MKKRRKRKGRWFEITSQDESIQLVTHWCVPLAGKRQIATLHFERGVSYDSRYAPVSSGRDARRLNAPLVEGRIRVWNNGDNGGATTQPLLPASQPANQPANHPASQPSSGSLAPRSIVATPVYRLSNPPPSQHWKLRGEGLRVSPRARQTGGGVCWWNYFAWQKLTLSRLSLSFYCPQLETLEWRRESLGIWRARGARAVSGADVPRSEGRQAQRR